jgi:hypothetical protein
MDLAVPNLEGDDDLFGDDPGAGARHDAGPPHAGYPAPPAAGAYLGAPGVPPPPSQRRAPPKKTVVVGAPPDPGAMAGAAAGEEGFGDVAGVVDGLDLGDDMVPAPYPPQPPPGERKHKTGELPVSGYLVVGGPAPPPVPSERAAPLQCFLCRQPFTQDDIRGGRLRRIKDNYYCLACCGGF